MKKKIHSESEMVKAVQQLESGVDAETIAREHGISRATLYNWKSKYSGMEVSQVKRLKELEEENRKLKQMYADLALDNRILKEVIEKNSRARDQKGPCKRNRRRIWSEHLSGVQDDGHPQILLLIRIGQRRHCCGGGHTQSIRTW